MKKISIISLILLGGLYISNANALQVDSTCRGGRECYWTSAECASQLIEACNELGVIRGYKAKIEGTIGYSQCKDKNGKTCYNCWGTCMAGSTQYTVDTTSSDKPTLLSADPNFGTTTSTTAPKSKNLKK